MILRFTLVFGLLLCLVGCSVESVRAPVEPSFLTFQLPRGKDEAFSAALAVGNELNMDVAVLERQSGLVRFQVTPLTPSELDSYCAYPVIYSDKGDPTDTFEGWDQRSMSYGMGNVNGIASITLTLSEVSSHAAEATVRGSWSAANSKESYPCNSTMKLEEQFKQALIKRLNESTFHPDKLKLGEGTKSIDWERFAPNS